MKVGLSAEALADAEQAADWYIDQDAWPAAQAFHEELAKAVARISADPGLGTPARGGVHILPIHRFPYSLVYRLIDDEVRVIAVAAQRRRPGFWRGRRRRDSQPSSSVDLDLVVAEVARRGHAVQRAGCTCSNTRTSSATPMRTTCSTESPWCARIGRVHANTRQGTISSPPRRWRWRQLRTRLR